MNKKFEELTQQAFEQFTNGHLKESKLLLLAAERTCPNDFNVVHTLGVIFGIEGNPESAIKYFRKAVDLNPTYNLGHFNLGRALAETGNDLAAIKHHKTAIALKPDHPEAWLNFGKSSQNLRNFDDALDCFDQATCLNPGYAEAWTNKGVVLYELRRFDEALVHYDHAISLKPDYAEAWSNKGVVLYELRRFEEALAHYDHAISLKPDYAEAWSNKGLVLYEHNRVVEALAHYDRALTLKPDLDFVFGTYLLTKMMLCDWNDFQVDIQKIRSLIINQKKVSTPFPLLVLLDQPELHKQASKHYAQSKFSGGPSVPQKKDKPTICLGKKIRIAYFSSDFREHAVAYLIAGLLESHDRNRFEIYGCSLSAIAQDKMQQRIINSCDRFFDFHDRSDKEVHEILSDLKIDIGIDLGGYTKYSRTQLFAQRSMPIQINYLGYVGTMGSNYYDYIIADRIVVPEKHKTYFTEKIIYLPNSFQVNDSKKHISERVFTREELGLPVSGFIFCCFNNNYKILPRTFSAWMRIMKAVDRSTLWLLEDGPQVVENLRKEAECRGIDADRLVFAKRLPRADYLARYRVADLFLDTLPYNAGTTASDALWCGLPVLTCVGISFASRMAASLLANVGLPELITHTYEEYESMAIQLAFDPKRLAQIKTKLADNKITQPLFDTSLFAKDIELAYRAVFDRYCSGLKPDHIYVED
ncbi:MAG: tetratricopeptide repeat protein [Burkholderiaceae bacterium]